MKTITSYRLAVMGLAALTLIVGVSCGKKKSGGGAVATPPATQDCTDGKCEAGQTYGSGVYLLTAEGYANYGYDKQMKAVLGFFGTDTNYKKESNSEVHLDYDGGVAINGKITISNLYAGVKKLITERKVSSLTFDLNFGFGGYTGGYNNYGYYQPQPTYPTYDYGYYQPSNPGYYQPCGTSCGGCGTSCGGGNGGYEDECTLADGSYTVTTVTAGTWYGYYSQFENIKVKLSGPVAAEAVLTQGYVNTVHAYGSNKNELQAEMIITKVGGKTCNTPVIF